VLAAGRGSRFGEAPKLLAHLHGKPSVRHVAEAALASAADPVFVVTGHRSGEVEAALIDLPSCWCRIAPMPRVCPPRSRPASLALDPDTEAAIVLLGDMPLVGPALIDRLIARWRESRPAAIVPVVEGQRGNPVVLSTSLRPEVERLTGDVGAGPLLRGRADVLEEAMDDEAAVRDVDTPAALAALSAR
jgi:molybdenum cofactor cytidylyltransferase